MWNKQPTISEAREIKYIMTYMGIYPHESWVTKSKAVMRALKERKFNVSSTTNGWEIRKAV
jgi:hypothetical protein